MPAERLSMRKLREILRLHFENKLSGRAIARSCRASCSTVQDYLRRAEVAKLAWPLPSDVDDVELEKLLFPNEHVPVRTRPEPDWVLVHRDLQKKHVTKLLVWQEYREAFADGMQYSQFCERYGRWRQRLGLVWRRDHKAGERTFVDFSGDGITLVDPKTGECQTAKLFVAVLGASNLTYVEPVLSENLPTWIQCHINAFAYFGGVTDIVVPDNLKSGVTKPDYYDPELNRTYASFAEHYAMAVIPARIKKPRDKAKVEQRVLLAERWVIAVLRHREFHSLAELKEAVRVLNERLNDRLMKKLGASRRQLFEAVERGALKPLPVQPFELCEWKKVRVNIDYHVEFDHHYYSVHYSHYINDQRDMEVRATATGIEVFYAGKRVAAHARSYDPVKRYVTLPEHMPAAHRHNNLEWPPSRFIAWGKSIGPFTEQFISELLERRRHPEQAFKSCMGVFRLGDDFSRERLERACALALRMRAFSSRSVRNILRNNRDTLADAEVEPPQLMLPLHENVRGSGYYH
jgi:transposase